MEVLIFRGSHANSNFIFHRCGKFCGYLTLFARDHEMDTWQAVLDIVEKKINQQSYNTWFKPTQLIKHDDKALYVRVPNAFFQDWLNDHIDVVVEAARLAGMGDIRV